MFLKLIDSDTYPLPNTKDRFYHLATLTKGFREFMCLHDNLKGKTYIEETTTGSLQFIQEELLVEEIARFLEDKGITKFKAMH